MLFYIGQHCYWTDFLKSLKTIPWLFKDPDAKEKSPCIPPQFWDCCADPREVSILWEDKSAIIIGISGIRFLLFVRVFLFTNCKNSI